MKPAITLDIHIFVAAVSGGHDTFYSWPSPPPVRGNLAANALGICNDAREFSLYLTEHILANIVRVLTAGAPHGYGWSVEKATDYVQLLVEIAEASGGAVIEPATPVADCEDFEDNRILECALASSSVLIVSDDAHLTSMSPWRGIPVITCADFVKRTDARRRARKR